MLDFHTLEKLCAHDTAGVALHRVRPHVPGVMEMGEMSVTRRETLRRKLARFAKRMWAAV